VPVVTDDAADPVTVAMPPDHSADPAAAIMIAGPVSMAAGIVMMMAVAMTAMGVLRGGRLRRQAVDAQRKNSGKGDFHDPQWFFSHTLRRGRSRPDLCRDPLVSSRQAPNPAGTDQRERAARCG